MKSLTSRLIILGSVGLTFLAACSNNNQATSPDSPAAPSETSAEMEQSDQAGENLSDLASMFEEQL